MSEERRRQLITTIKALMAYQHLTQQQLADKAGISRQALVCVLRGDNVTLDTLDKIGNALNHELY